MNDDLKKGVIIMNYLKSKRLMDIIVSILGVIFLSPIFLVIGVLIKLDSKGPVFFIQERSGKHKKPFEMYKFRTMKICTPKNRPTFLLDNPEQHITRVGRFLRKTSLDEIPQIINIIKKEMSIVGPRPVIYEETELIDAREEVGANDLLPGLTGWAQINGRDTISTKDKARYDEYYTQNIGFKLDVKCFFGTITCVLRKKGLLEGGTGTSCLKEERV